MWLFVWTWLLHCALAYNVEKLKKDGLARARVELNRMREVKAFVNQDIPLYHNLVKKHIPGADPELVLLNHYYHELDRIDLSDMTRSEINELLGELGFYKKAQPEEEVPEEFRFAPAKDSPFEDPPKSQSTSPPTEKTSSESQSTSPPTEKTSSESQSTSPPTEKTSSESQSTSPPTENTSEPESEAMRSEL